MLRRLLVLLSVVISLGFAATITSSSAEKAEKPDLVEASLSTALPTTKSTTNSERLLEQLNITPEQEEEIAAIREKYLEPIKENYQAMELVQKELRQMMMEEGHTNSELRSQYSELVECRESLASLRFESMLAIRDVLTPEQRQELAKIIESQPQPTSNLRRWWR